jgi:hypothetical protein
MSRTRLALTPEAIEAAKAVGRGFRFSSEQKQLIAELMTPLLEKWAVEQVPVERKAVA